MKNCLKLKENLIQAIKVFDFNNGDTEQLPRFNKMISDIIFEYYSVLEPEKDTEPNLCNEIEVGEVLECTLPQIPNATPFDELIDTFNFTHHTIEPVTVEPVTVEPVTVEPVTVEPVTVEPVTVESEPPAPAPAPETNLPKFKPEQPIVHNDHYFCYFKNLKEYVLFANIERVEEIDWVREINNAMDKDLDLNAEAIIELLTLPFDNSLYPRKDNIKVTILDILENGLNKSKLHSALRKVYEVYSKPKVEKNIVVLTDHQQEIFDGVINKIDKIMAIPRGTHIQAVQEAPAKYMVVFEGAAGTGKTTTMGKVLDTLIEKGYSICFCSPTHQALGVIREMLQEAMLEFTESPDDFINFNNSEGIIIRTLASFLGLKMKRNLETGEESFTTDKKAITFKVDILAIDESSMVSKDQIMLLLKRLRVDFNMILFIGDEPQLPSPSDKNEANGIFNLPYKYSLIKVVRQAEGSQLLQLAHYIRNLILTNTTIYSPSQIITEQLTNNYDIVVFKDQGMFLNEYANDMEPRKILSTYTNNITNEYNSYMRNLAITNQLPGTKLDIDTVGNAFSQTKDKVNFISDWKDYKEFFPGEKLVVGETNQRGGSVIHQNGEIITIESVEKVTDHIYIETPSENMMEASIIVEYKVEYFKIVDTSFRSIFVIANEYKELYTQLLSLLSAEAHRRTGKQKWKKYWDFKEKYTKVNYTFGATLYKLQGSTYGHLYADLRDLDKFHRWNPVIVYKLLYVALTRPKQKIIILI